MTSSVLARLVLVDDRFPSTLKPIGPNKAKVEFAFSKSARHTLWVPLIEKAMAKLFGPPPPPHRPHPSASARMLQLHVAVAGSLTALCVVVDGAGSYASLESGQIMEGMNALTGFPTTKIPLQVQLAQVRPPLPPPAGQPGRRVCSPWSCTRVCQVICGCAGLATLVFVTPSDGAFATRTRRIRIRHGEDVDNCTRVPTGSQLHSSHFLCPVRCFKT